MIYTGIGSREVPIEVYETFIKLGKSFARRGDILRSGGATGCDTAFESGCDAYHGQKEIYLPWRHFNQNASNYLVRPEAFEIAKQFHPKWDSLSQGAQKLHARNAHQILGYDLKTPTQLVICYTEHGLLKGGTAQALRMAKAYHIPILNAGDYEGQLDAFVQAVKTFIKA